MAEKIVSPGVFTNEIDQSFLPAAIGEIGAAVIGPTVKGPAFVPTVVSSYSEYVQIFGETYVSASNNYTFLTSHAAKEYLRHGNTLTVCRVMSGSSYAQATSSVVSASTEIFKLYTHGHGTVENSSGSEDSNGILANGTTNNIRWEVNGLNNRKGTFNLVIRQGNDTTKRKQILETWNNLSMDPNAKNFVSKVIGDSELTIAGSSPDRYLQPSGAFPNKSKYVFIKMNNAFLTPNYLDNAGQTSSAAFTASLPQNGSGSFGTGDDGEIKHPMTWYEDIAQDTQGITVGAASTEYGGYRTALDLLGNPDEFDMNLVMMPGIVNDQTNHSSVIDYAIQKAEDRADCLVLADPGGYGQAISSAVTQAEGYDSNYAAMYYPWVQVLDNNTGMYRWAPPSTVLGGVFAFNDKVAQPWFAPAGLNRGGLDGVIQTERKLTHNNRDTLYEGNVNPIATFPGQGICAWGQKTLQKKSSALDRINVRRLLIRVKKFIASSSRFLVFEQNNAATRTRFLNIVNPFLENVQSQSGLNAFKVVMDDTNNTPDVVDRNILYGQLFLQPTKTAEFIVLDFVVQPTGAAFPE